MDKKELIREAVSEIHLRYIENAAAQKEGKPSSLNRRRLRKAWIAAAAAALLCLAAGGIITGVILKERNAKGPVTDSVISSKTVWYESLEEMEKAASVIVIGKKLGEDHLLYSQSSPDHMPIGTVSTFQTETILKDDGTLQPGSVLQILEQDYYDEALRTRYHVAGYTAMNTSDRYVLHLVFSDPGKTIYVPMGVNFGVASLGEDYRMVDYQNGESGGNGLIDRIREETREKYLDYDVIDDYPEQFGFSLKGIRAEVLSEGHDHAWDGRRCAFLLRLTGEVSGGGLDPASMEDGVNWRAKEALDLANANYRLAHQKSLFLLNRDGHYRSTVFVDNGAKHYFAVIYDQDTDVYCCIYGPY